LGQQNIVNTVSFILTRLEKVQRSASAYQRHQTILQMLEDANSVRVADLAQYLHVSESTIRNDLEQLDEQGQLVRVRGGAVANFSAQPQQSTPNFQDKLTRHAEQKRRIGRWAASMIEDGDVIMLDASSTVLHIAPFLADRHKLTVFTNGIHVAQLLAKEASNTVIVLGGILLPNGNSLTGSISEQVLQDYHIQKAFVSCSGFKSEIGFFEADLQEAEIKALMLKATEQRIVLFDSSKVGQIGPTTFATLDDADYVAVDDGVDRNTVEAIRRSQTHVIVCSEQTNHAFPPKVVSSTGYRIGFANLSEHTSFSRDVRRGLQKAVADTGGIDLILADNQLDPEIARQVADELIAQDLDLVIEYQIDESAGNYIAHRFQTAGIPTIAVDIPMVGATYFGVDNYIAGKMAGVELGKAIAADWNEQFDTLIIVEQTRAGKLPAMRIQGQLDGFAEALSPISEDHMICVDFDNTEADAYRILIDTLNALPTGQRIAMICFNDDAAFGALRAARETGHIDNLKLVGQGADRRLRMEMRQPGTPVVGATAFCPETYGERLLQLTQDILDGRPVAPAIYTEHFFVTPANVNDYYPGDQDEDPT
jgi:ribose transport system substrate-binding protein